MASVSKSCKAAEEKASPVGHVLFYSQDFRERGGWRQETNPDDKEWVAGGIQKRPQ